MKNYFLSNNNGFTLIELIMIIILLGILSATAVVLVGNVLEQQKFDETVKEMNELKKAMLGNPELISSGARSSFGSVGDVGSLPSSLTALVEKGALPVFQKTGGTGGYDAALPDLGTGAGWRGPYIDDKKDDSGNYIALRDGWGNPYTYDSATGQVTSTGGGAGNIVIPESSVASQLAGGVTGTVRGNQGNPVEGATVRIYYPNGSGAHTTWNKTTSSSGFYNFSSIPIGRRTIRVTSGSLTLSDTVVVDGGQTQTKDIVIADQIAPNPPTGTAAARASYTSLNLSWTASTSPDLAGYKIYRGTTSGGEVLYKTNITGTSYVDDNSGAGLSAKATYYYRMSAVDTAGNESTLTAEVGKTVNPIQQTTATTFSYNGSDRYDGSVTNYGNENISITQMKITWNCSNNATTVNQVRLSGTAYGVAGSNGVTFNVGPQTYNASATDATFRVRFAANNDCRISTNPAYYLIIEFNPTAFDGKFTAAVP